MKQPINSKRMSINLKKDFKNRLATLADLEHRRLGEQIIHMTEFYLNHQIETKNKLEECIQRQYELSESAPQFIKTPPENKEKPQLLKTSQVIQRNKGLMVSDVPDKKVKTEFDNQQDI